MKEATIGYTKSGKGYKLYKDIPYGAEEKQDLDLYIPDGEAPAGGWPALFYVHGGGFIAGDKSDRGLGMEFAQLVIDYGIALVSANHRLPGREPEQLDIELADVQAGLRYVAEHAEEMGINKDKIACQGQSAGGALVCAAAVRAKAEGAPPAIAVISIASATDITDVPAHVHEDAPPFFIIHGTADSIVKISQPERLITALEAAGVHYVYMPVEGGEHTRPIDDPNTMVLIEEQGKLHDAYDWLKAIIAG